MAPRRCERTIMAWIQAGAATQAQSLKPEPMRQARPHLADTDVQAEAGLALRPLDTQRHEVPTVVPAAAEPRSATQVLASEDEPEDAAKDLWPDDETDLEGTCTAECKTMWPSPPSRAEPQWSDEDVSFCSPAGALGEKAGSAEEVRAAVALAAQKRIGEESGARKLDGDGPHRQCPQRFLELLEDAVAAKDVGMRSRLGQSFARWLKASPEKAEEYNAIRCAGATQRLKREFRLRWASAELAQRREVLKAKASRIMNVDEDVGTYESFDAIVEREGGRHSKAAVQAAETYCRKALALGGRFIMRNHMTERVDFLYVKKTHRDVFQQSWTMEETETIVSTGDEPADNAKELAGVAPPCASCPAAKQTPKGKRKQLEDGVAVEAGDGLPTGKKVRGGGAVVLSQESRQKLAGRARVAAALKQRYQAATTTHARLLQNLQQDPAWAWAQTERVQGRLAEAEAAVRAAMDSMPFNSFFVLSTIAVVKATRGDDLCRSLQQLVDAMEKPVAA